MKILVTADLHIGRRPTRLPPSVNCGPLSCAQCWTSIVEHAIAERVDLVLLAGDVVDAQNRFYEATGPLEAGVRRLGREGIRTVAVAGNHDYDVLPSLTRGLGEDFRLLGRGGRWDSYTHENGDGRPLLRVHGWSFQSGHHRDDPLGGYDLENDGRAPVLGLLHADLDQPGSAYAPVRSADLRSRQVDFWLLGHVHAPVLRDEGGSPILYPGSPQAMDPGETGAHGAWMVEIDGGRRFTARPVALSRVRYDTVEVAVDGVRDLGELNRRVSDAVDAHLRAVVEEGCGPLRWLSCRLRLTGATPLHRALDDEFAARVGEMELVHGDVCAIVERVRVATRPERDLADLSRGHDAPAEVARLLLALEGVSGGRRPSEPADELLAAAKRTVGDLAQSGTYRLLPPEVRDRFRQMSDEELAERLASRGGSLLDSLFATKEAS